MPCHQRNALAAKELFDFMMPLHFSALFFLLPGLREKGKRAEFVRESPKERSGYHYNSLVIDNVTASVRRVQ
jgi:hypothetical protein